MTNETNKSALIPRLLVVGGLTLILLIPAVIVNFLVQEREQRQREATEETSSKWGDSQQLTGPILTVPFKQYETVKNGAKDSLVLTKSKAYFLPEELKINGSVAPQILKRGIYESTVYNTQLKFEGSFSAPDFQDWKISAENIIWDEAILSFGIPDMRGVKDKMIIKWQDKILTFNPGIPDVNLLDSGVSIKVPLNQSAKYTFSFEVNLDGSKELNFIPLGKETNVLLTSNWANPSFGGAFLPDSRELTKDGFKAEWKILNLNRNYPQSFLVVPRDLAKSAFGVKLLVPVDQYQKTTRSIKYAIMFIALTFLTFFFVEISNKKRIHPIQYLLVGFALLVFYTLLLSISEHISFNLAYLISSLAVIAMIVLYSKALFQNNILTMILGAILVGLYGFMYIVLQLQDLALLMGSIGLFAVLGIVMYISRKIDWYSNISEVKNNTHL